MYNIMQQSEQARATEPDNWPLRSKPVKLLFYSCLVSTAHQQGLFVPLADGAAAFLNTASFCAELEQSLGGS